MVLRIVWFVCCALLVGGVLPARAETETTLVVPPGAAPALDGVLSEGEWDDAVEVPLSDDSFLYAKHCAGFLYLGVRTAPDAEVVGNVYIARDETVDILHASHALGTATYRLVEDAWRLQQPFAWSCRTLGFSEAALAERAAFLDENGWLATVVNLGEVEHMEYRIAIESEPLRMLFRFDVHRDAQEVVTWPLCTDVGLAPGPLPQEAAFRPDEWCTVSFAALDQPTLSVPAGEAPALDGTLSAGEWDDATEIQLNSRTTLFLKHAGGTLYVGVSARTMGVVSPCIVRGDDVWVLHASAALGTAIYEQGSDTWSQTQDFTWRCRATGFDDAALREREAFLEQEAWLGTIGYLGTRRHFEYRIELLGEDTLPILFLFLDPGPPIVVVSWPMDLSGADDYTELITGPVPKAMSFDIGTWALLRAE